jgi:hypothetical protein
MVSVAPGLTLEGESPCIEEHEAKVAPMGRPTDAEMLRFLHRPLRAADAGSGRALLIVTRSNRGDPPVVIGGTTTRSIIREAFHRFEDLG